MEIDFDDLPRLTKEVSMVIGYEKLLTLLNAPRLKKRRCIYVPKTYNKNHWLVRLLGIDTMRTLVAEYGGEQLYIAKGTRNRHRKRNKGIVSLRKNGTPSKEVARLYGMTDTCIRNIYSRYKERYA